jgi:hypothetical protein
MKRIIFLLTLLVCFLFPTTVSAPQQKDVLSSIEVRLAVISQMLADHTSRLDRIEIAENSHVFVNTSTGETMTAGAAVAITSINEKLAQIAEDRAFNRDLLLAAIGATIAGFIGMFFHGSSIKRSQQATAEEVKSRLDTVDADRAKKLEEISKTTNGTLLELLDRYEQAQKHIRLLELEVVKHCPAEGKKV